MQVKLTLAAAALLIASQASATNYSIDNLTARYGEGYTWLHVNNGGELAGVGGTTWSRSVELRLRSGSVSYLDDSLFQIAPSALANDGTVYYQGLTYDVFGKEYIYSKRRGLDGTITPMPAFREGLPTRVTDVNDHGIAVGSAPDESSYTRAAIFKDGKVTAIGPANEDTVADGINNHGAVVGHDLLNTHSFMYADGKLTNFDGQVTATKINDANVVAGSRLLANGNETAFLYKDGVFTDITVAGKSYSQTIDLNNSGMLLGYAFNSFDATPTQYFVYANGETIVLNDLVAAQGYAGWNFGQVYDINDNGQVLVSLYRDVNDVRESRQLLLSPVPEPGTWAMLLAGLACVGMVKRRARAA
ncbi:putative secreted protein with PEP-CTERM sorting signal [Pseudoduganella flava]|uniref:PEP-CTERM sorting domain-containing protein n=1 Tax=Pseudoduganella flava TaxID=871742 RepID=A0A562PJF9_9BURK|nr:PEP-CTERM sorting domain-containing protein [Pseudoduganella flava]QGZ42079.1 PEP-CTERM sorting domain-containing protein [Pseudoduganella flava]TWI44508.1 putative secreted protein with PEP-CTERM sorting signal [Pseudoduganella flava]